MCVPQPRTLPQASGSSWPGPCCKPRAGRPQSFLGGAGMRAWQDGSAHTELPRGFPRSSSLTSEGGQGSDEETWSQWQGAGEEGVGKAAVALWVGSGVCTAHRRWWAQRSGQEISRTPSGPRQGEAPTWSWRPWRSGAEDTGHTVSVRHWKGLRPPAKAGQATLLCPGPAPPGTPAAGTNGPVLGRASFSPHPCPVPSAPRLLHRVPLPPHLGVRRPFTQLPRLTSPPPGAWPSWPMCQESLSHQFCLQPQQQSLL